jgi:hypothetical protein
MSGEKVLIPENKVKFKLWDAIGNHLSFNESLRKANQSHYRPGQALRVPGVRGYQISKQSAHGGKFVSPTYRPPLLPRKYSWYSFLLEAESTPGPQ